MTAMPTALALLLSVAGAASAQAPALIPQLRPILSDVPSLGEIVVRPAPRRAPVLVFALRPSSPARAAAERAFFDAALARLESTEEGRRIVADLSARGMTVPVSFALIPGTKVSTEGGAEFVDGVAGYFTRDDGRLTFSDRFLALRDPAAAQASLATTLAHEAEHARLHAVVAALAPWFGNVLTIDAANERNAFLSEFLVASELGIEGVEVRDARSVTADAPKFWERKRLGRPLYALALTLEEMSDPVAAWQGRLVKLKEKQAKAARTVSDTIPFNIELLEHMERAHGLRAPDLRREITEDLAELQGTVKSLQETIDYLESRVAMMDDAQRKSDLLRDLRLAAANPGYRAVTDLVAQKAARLAALVPPAPPAPPAAPGTMTWDDFYDRVDEDRAKHPEHWDPSTRGPVSLGPTWKVLLAELSEAGRG
ncbi:hypothetical protein EPO15_08230 [bacterium]|nr:MAG: hypothetical protein EPO15_08230 [bacterium]